jgi:NADP-dependent 3-hydroxy acid dehydrogenase YdfG
LGGLPETRIAHTGFTRDLAKPADQGHDPGPDAIPSNKESRMTMATSQPSSARRALLDGRVAVVTGAASGIGAAVAERLASEGARVALLARREGRLRALAERINSSGGTAHAIRADVTDSGALSAAADEIADVLGTVDVLVNNAGVMLPGEITSQPLSEWQRMIDTNLVGALNAIRALLPPLIDAAAARGVADLINVSSIGGKTVFPRYAVYGATKAALTQLSAMLRTELSPLGVRVSDLQPGLTESELAGNVTDADSRAGLDEMFEHIAPLTSADIADLIVYLVTRPPHVNISTLDIVPTRQA